MAHAPQYQYVEVEVDDNGDPVNTWQRTVGGVGLRYAIQQWGRIIAVALTNSQPWPVVSPYAVNLGAEAAAGGLPPGVLPDFARDTGEGGGPPVDGGVDTETAFRAVAEEYTYWAGVALDVMHRAATIGPDTLRVNRRRKLAGLVMQAAINGVADSDMFEVGVPKLGEPAASVTRMEAARRTVLDAAVSGQGVSLDEQWTAYADAHNHVGGGTDNVDWAHADAGKAIAAVLQRRVRVPGTGPRIAGVTPMPTRGVGPPERDAVDAFQAAVQTAWDNEMGAPPGWFIGPRPDSGDPPSAMHAWLRSVVTAFKEVDVDLPINTDPVRVPEASATGIRCVLVQSAEPVRDMPAGSTGADLRVEDIRGWLARTVAEIVHEGAAFRPRVFFTASDAAVKLFVVSPVDGVSVFAASAGTADADLVYREDGVPTIVPRGTPFAMAAPILRWRLGAGITNMSDPPSHMGNHVDVDPAAFADDDTLTHRWSMGVIDFCLQQMAGETATGDLGPTGAGKLTMKVGTPMCNNTDLYTIEADPDVAHRRQLMTAALRVAAFDRQSLFGCLLPVAWSRAPGVPNIKLHHDYAPVNTLIDAHPDADTGLQRAIAGVGADEVPLEDQVDNTMAATLQRVYLATHGYSPMAERANAMTLVPDVVAACSAAGYALGPVRTAASCAKNLALDPTRFRIPTVGSWFGPRPMLPPELDHASPFTNPAQVGTTRYFEFCRATADAAFRAAGTAAAAGIESYPFRDHSDAVIDMISGIVVDTARPAFEWLPNLSSAGTVTYIHPVNHAPVTMSNDDALDVLFDALAYAGANLVGGGVAAASEPMRSADGDRGWTTAAFSTQQWTAHAFAAAAAEFVRTALRGPQTRPVDMPATRTADDDSDSDGGDVDSFGGAEESKVRDDDTLFPPPPVTENNPDAQPTPHTLRLVGLVLFNNFLGTSAFQDTARTHVVGSNLPRNAAMYVARALGCRLMAFDTETADGGNTSMDDLEDTRGILAFLINAALCRKPRYNDSSSREFVASMVRKALSRVGEFGRGFVVPTDADPVAVVKLQAVYDTLLAARFPDHTNVPDVYMDRMHRSAPGAAGEAAWSRGVGETAWAPGRMNGISTNSESVAAQWERHTRRTFQAYVQSARGDGGDEELRAEANAIHAGDRGPSIGFLQSAMTVMLFPSLLALDYDDGTTVKPLPCMGATTQPAWRPVRFLALGPKTAYSCTIDETDLVMRAVSSGIEHRFPICEVPMEDPADAPLPVPRPMPGDSDYDSEDSDGDADAGVVHVPLPHPDPVTDAHHKANWRAYLAGAAKQNADRVRSNMVASTTAVLDNIMTTWAADNLRIHTVLFDPNHVLGVASGPQWALIRPDPEADTDSAAQTAKWAQRVRTWGLYYARLLWNPESDDQRKHPSLDAALFHWKEDPDDPASPSFAPDEVYRGVRQGEVDPVGPGADEADMENPAQWASNLKPPVVGPSPPLDDGRPSVYFDISRPYDVAREPVTGFSRGDNFISAALYIHPRLRGLRGSPSPAVIEAERKAAADIAAAGGDPVPDALDPRQPDPVAGRYIAVQHKRDAIAAHGITALERSILAVLRQAVTAVLDVYTLVPDDDAGEARFTGHQTTTPQDVLTGLATYSHGGTVDTTVRPVTFATPTPDGWRATQGPAIVATVDLAMPDSRNVLDNSILSVYAMHAGLRTAFATTMHNTMRPQRPPPNVALLETYVASADIAALDAPPGASRRLRALRSARLMAADPVNAPRSFATLAGLHALADTEPDLPAHAGMPGADPADAITTERILADVMKHTTARSTMLGRFAYTICGRIDNPFDPTYAADNPHFLSLMHTSGQAVAVVHLDARPFPGFDPLAEEGEPSTAFDAYRMPARASAVRTAGRRAADAAAALADAATASDTDNNMAVALQGIMLAALHDLHAAAPDGTPTHKIQMAALVRSGTSFVTFTLHTSGFRTAIRPDVEYAHVATYTTAWKNDSTLRLDTSFAAAFHGVFAGVIHKRWNIRSFCAQQNLPWCAAVLFGVGFDAAVMRAVYEHYLTPMKMTRIARDGDPPYHVYPTLPTHWDGTTPGFMRGTHIVVDTDAARPGSRHILWGATVARLGVEQTRSRASAIHIRADDETLDTLGLLAAYAVHVQPFYGNSSMQTPSVIAATPRPAIHVGVGPRPPVMWAHSPHVDSRHAPVWCKEIHAAATAAGVKEPFHVAAFIMTQFLFPFSFAPGVKDAFGRLPATALTVDGVGTGDGADPKYALLPLHTVVPVAVLVMPRPAALPNAVADLTSYVYALVAALPRAQRHIVRDTIRLIMALTLFNCPSLGVTAAPYAAIAPGAVHKDIRLARTAALERAAFLFALPARTLMEATWSVVTPVVETQTEKDRTLVACVHAAAINRSKHTFSVQDTPIAGCEPYIAVTAVDIFNADANIDISEANTSGLSVLPLDVTAKWMRKPLEDDPDAGWNAAQTSAVATLQPGFVYYCSLSFAHGRHTAIATMPTIRAIGTTGRDTSMPAPKEPFHVPVHAIV